jgi:hypothetical protein
LTLTETVSEPEDSGARVRLTEEERATADAVVYASDSVEALMYGPDGVRLAQLVADSPAVRDYLCTFGIAGEETADRAVEVAAECAIRATDGKRANGFAAVAWLKLTLGEADEAHEFAHFGLGCDPEHTLSQLTHDASVAMLSKRAYGPEAIEAFRRKMIAATAETLEALTRQP